MTTLTITTGSHTHTLALAPDANWSEVWSPTPDSLDVRLFSRKIGDAAWECELRAGNTSVVPGDPSKSKPLIAADVEVQGAPGIRRWPSIYPMGRATWRRFIFGGRQIDPDFRPDWRQRAKAYGPCDLPLPMLGNQQAVAVMNACQVSLRIVEACMNAGTPFTVDDTMDGVLSPWNGWMPHGPPNPDDVGGSGIYLGSTGWPQNKHDLRRAYLLAQAEGDRGKWFENRTDGEPISTEHYPGETPDVWGYGNIPESFIANDGGDPLPPQYGFAHEIRGFRRTMQIAEQADSPMAKHIIRGLANLERLRFSPRGRPAIPGYTPMNLRVLQDAANQDPHGGIFGSIAGRQIAWPGFLVAEDLKLNGVHGENATWAAAFLRFLDTAVTPTGPIQKDKGGSGGWPTTAFACQTFEQPMLATAGVGLAKRTDVSSPIFAHRILESIYGPATLCQILPYDGSWGPPHYLRTAGDDGKPVTRIKDALTTYGDPAHAEHACALAASIDPNPSTWVERGRLYGHQFPDVKSKLDWLTSSSVTGLDWTAFWVAQAQAIPA